MSNRDALMSFVAGIVVGGTAAVLYAPQSGEGTRQKLRDTGREAGLKAQEYGTRAKETATEVANDVEQKLSNVASQVAGKATNVRNALDKGHEAFKASLSQA